MPWLQSSTHSASGQRVAASRRRRSVSTSSGTAMRKGSTVGHGQPLSSPSVAGDRDVGGFGASAQHHRAVGRPSARRSASSARRDGGTGGQRPAGVVLAASARRAASLTGIADHRVLVAVLGADVACEHRPGRHPDAEVDDGQRAQVRGERAGRARVPRRRRRRSDRRAEHGERGVALELVDRARRRSSTAATTIRKKSLRTSATSCGRAGGGQLRRPGQVDEQDRDVAHLAGPGVVGLDGQSRDVGPDVAAEEVAEAVAFGRARRPCG